MNQSVRTPLLLAASVALSLMLPSAAKSLDDTRARAEQKESQTPALGLGLAPLDSPLKAQLGKVIGKDRGVMITEVATGAAAENAGLRPFDILCTYNGKDISSPEQLAKLVHNGKVDEEVSLEYVREGVLNNVKVKLSAMPEASDRKLARRIEPIWPIDNWIRFNEVFADSDDAPSVAFEAMTIKKLPDNKYMARIEFLDKENNKVEREYTGKIGELRRAIRSDKELPRQQQQHLIRSLQSRSMGEDLNFGSFGWNSRLSF